MTEENTPLPLLRPVMLYDASWEGPFCTRHGCAVRNITCRQINSLTYPVSGLVELPDRAVIHHWTNEGRSIVDATGPMDLCCAEEIPPVAHAVAPVAPEVTAPVKKRGEVARPTGGHVDYYRKLIRHPTRQGVDPYTAECEDIIIALGMTPQEACVFKEVWRTASARQHNGKVGHTALYGAEKIAHYGALILQLAQQAAQDEEESDD